MREASLSPGSRRGQLRRALQGLTGVLLLVILLLSSVLLSGAEAAERAQPFRIGALTASWGPTPATAGLRDGLLALGYRESEQFDLGVRFTQGDLTALPTAARELVQYGVDLIFAHNADAAKAAQQATDRIPIVFTGVTDPIGLGLIHSFARPGGNLTGVTELRDELSPKRLELFHAIIPGLRRVLYVYDPNSAAAVASMRVFREAARRRGIVLVEHPVQTAEDARAALTQARPGAVDGIVQPPSLALNIPGGILEATVQRGIPAIFDDQFYVEQGGLVSYGPGFYESGRLAARLVDKILKGANPADIPVEANPKIEFAINLKTAKVLGLTIAPELLYQADRLIR